MHLLLDALHLRLFPKSRISSLARGPPIDEDLKCARCETSPILAPWAKISFWTMVLPSDADKRGDCVYIRWDILYLYDRYHIRTKAGAVCGMNTWNPTTSDYSLLTQKRWPKLTDKTGLNARWLHRACFNVLTRVLTS